jgi:hypothetical protein
LFIEFVFAGVRTLLLCWCVSSLSRDRDLSGDGHALSGRVCSYEDELCGGQSLTPRLSAVCCHEDELPGLWHLLWTGAFGYSSCVGNEVTVLAPLVGGVGAPMGGPCRELLVVFARCSVFGSSFSCLVSL